MNSLQNKLLLVGYLNWQKQPSCYTKEMFNLPDLPTPSFPRTTARIALSVWWWTWPLRLFFMTHGADSDSKENDSSVLVGSFNNKAKASTVSKRNREGLECDYRHDGTPAHNNSEGRLDLMGFGFCLKKWNYWSRSFERPWAPTFLILKETGLLQCHEWVSYGLNSSITTTATTFRWNYEKTWDTFLKATFWQVTFTPRIINS